MSSGARVAVVAVLVLVAGAAAGVGCGGSDGPSATSTGPIPGPTTDTQSVSTPTTAAATTEPDAGDEEGIRVPATFTVAGDRLSPATVTVPPTLPVELRVTSADGQAHRLVFATSPTVTLTVGASGSAVRRVPGQRQGTIDVRIDGGTPIPALIVADDAGP